jgi:hypothetical protein
MCRTGGLPAHPGCIVLTEIAPGETAKGCAGPDGFSSHPVQGLKAMDPRIFLAVKRAAPSESLPEPLVRTSPTRLRNAMREVVIVSACRTPLGKFNGAFASLSARDLAIAAGKEAIAGRAGPFPRWPRSPWVSSTPPCRASAARQVSMRIGLPARSTPSA